MRSMVEGADWKGRPTMRTFRPTFRLARKLRRDMTLPEVLLWDCLRAGRLEGFRFRRQHPVGPYVLDFYCPSARLAVEIDGAHHDLEGQMLSDNRRDDWLRKRGIRILRIAASDILDDHLFEGALSAIAVAAATETIPAGYESPRWHGRDTPPPPPSAVPLPRFAGEDPRLRTPATPDLPPFTGEGDHAKRGEGGSLSRTDKAGKEDTV